MKKLSEWTKAVSEPSTSLQNSLCIWPLTRFCVFSSQTSFNISHCTSFSKQKRNSIGSESDKCHAIKKAVAKYCSQRALFLNLSNNLSQISYKIQKPVLTWIHRYKWMAHFAPLKIEWEHGTTWSACYLCVMSSMKTFWSKVLDSLLGSMTGIKRANSKTQSIKHKICTKK